MIHSGFDATFGSIELSMVKRGHALFTEFVKSCRERDLSLPWAPSGALMLATTAEELKGLEAVAEAARRNDVAVQMLTPQQVLAAEPHVRPAVMGGLLVPTEWSVDPWMYPALLLSEAVSAGRCEMMSKFRVVRRIRSNRNSTTLFAGDGRRVTVRCVVNCGGLKGDVVEELRCGVGRAPFEVVPRLGRFVVFGDGARPLVSRALLPLPTKKTKGVILFRTVHGQVFIGPTAEDPSDPRLPQAKVQQLLIDAAVGKVPTLPVSVSSVYAGARPSLKGLSDYYITYDASEQWLTVAGVRSTGLTSSVALGEYAVEVLADAHRLVVRKDHPVPTGHAVRAAFQSLVDKGILSVDHRHPISSEGWPRPHL